MSLRNRLALPIIFAALAALLGCGSSSNSSTPPPSGGYSDSDFKGTYVFSYSGTDVTSSSAASGTSFFAAAGLLSADGNGNVSGTIDLVDPELAAALAQTTDVFTGLSASGKYNVTSDGRGNGSVNVTVGSTGVTLGIDFVLANDSQGFITRFDNNGTGSGTLDMQSGTIAPSYPASYVFSLSGVDSTGDNPFVTSGAVTVDSSNNITAGIEDINDNKNINNSLGLSIGGTVAIGSGSSAGTAALVTGSSYGTLGFDVWPIDATHFKLIETDGVQLIAGDAFSAATSAPASGQFVYTMGGFDTSGDLLASGGFFSYDGSLNVSNGYEDINDAGTVGNSTSVSGTFSASGGRYVLDLGGFYNGGSGASTTSSPYVFVGYPFSSDGTSGVLLMEADTGGVSTGTAFPQTSQTFASTEGYGLNLSGANSGGEVDDIAEFVANSGGTLSNGLIDENDQGSLNFDQQLGNGGVYQFDSGATGRGEISYPNSSTAIGTLNLDFYVASNSNILFIDVDTSAQTGVGVLALQTSSSSSSSATAKPLISRTQQHFATLSATRTLKQARKKK